MVIVKVIGIRCSQRLVARTGWRDFMNSSVPVSCGSFPVPVIMTIPKGHFCSNRRDLRVLFLGSDAFSIASLEAVIQVFPASAITVVVSNENNLVGKFARRNDLRLVLWDTFKRSQAVSQSQSGTADVPKTKANDEADTENKFDLGVVSSFGYLIPERVIRNCKIGILNVHGSILPKWRGAAPTAHAIINGDKVTGISIMKIAPFKFDIGPVLHQESVPLHPHVRTPELTRLLAQVGSKALKEVLQNLNSFLVKAIPQDEQEACLAPKIVPEMSYIRWESQTAEQIYNLFRGLAGSFKLKTYYRGRQIDFDDLALLPDPHEFLYEGSQSEWIDGFTDFSSFYSPPGTVHLDNKLLPTSDILRSGYIFYMDNVLLVKCCSEQSVDVKRNWICIRKFKIGQKWMSAKDFRNGYLSKQGAPDRFESSISGIKSGSDRAVGR